MTANYSRVYTDEFAGQNRTRIRGLENAGPFTGDGLFYNWYSLTDLTINEFSHPAGDPTIDFGGKYIHIPAPGMDPSQTALTHVIFNCDITALGVSTVNQVWHFNFTLDPGRTDIQISGNGRLIHTEPDGSVIVYHLAFSPDSDAIFATAEGVDPAPGDATTGDTPGFLRASFPCNIAAGDTIEGWLWGMTQEGGD